MQALQWAESPEGVSDLRRFFHGRAEDFETEELAAFSEHLPADSATNIKASKLLPGTDMHLILLAKIHDLNLMNLYGQAGKKTPKKELILPTILPESEEKQKKVKASVEFWQAQKEASFDDTDFFSGEQKEK